MSWSRGRSLYPGGILSRASCASDPSSGSSDARPSPRLKRHQGETMMRKITNVPTSAQLLTITAALLATFCWATTEVARSQQVKTDDYGRRYARESDKIGYAAGELLKETPLYRFYGWYQKLSSGGEYYVKWCNDHLRSATVSIVFKADDNYKVENTPAYWKRFEDEMLPLITSRCPGGEVIAILNYVEGAQIEYLNRIVSRKVRE